MSRIALEYQGFLRYIARAEKEIIRWFGPSCNNDASKIVSMTATEWDSMADDEKHFFMQSPIFRSPRYKVNDVKGRYPFLTYRASKRYLNSLQSGECPEALLNQSPFHPKLSKYFGDEWKSLPDEEREKFSEIRLAELAMNHVIENRDRLHQLYEPKELKLLEFIIKTKPKRNHSSRSWFLLVKNLRINSPDDTWSILTPEQKRFYQDCAFMDKKRYKFAKSLWMTKLLSIDMESDEIALPDSELTDEEQNLGAVSTIIELSRDLDSTSSRIKKPPNAFCIFLKDFHAQHDEIKTFTGEHLKRSAEAWSALSEEDKLKYKEESSKLMEAYKEEQQHSVACQIGQPNISEITAGLFRHSKLINGASRPEHLYSTKIHSAENLYGRAHGIRYKDRKEVWQSLPDSEKEPYRRESEAMAEVTNSHRCMFNAKLGGLKELIYKAKQLEKLKCDMKLTRSRKREVKKVCPSDEELASI